MRIERVDLIAFGGFSETTLDFSKLPNGLQIVFGPNESGKSTSLRAITAWLFGIPTRSEDNYRHDYRAMRVGGMVSDPQFGELACVRKKGNKKTLLAADGQTQLDEQQLIRYLEGMDEESFLRGYGLDRDRLIEGGRAIVSGQGDLGEILFASGVGVSHLTELKETLETRRNELYKQRGSVPELNKVLKQIGEVRKALKEQTVSVRQFQDCERKLSDLQEAAARLQARRGEKTAELNQCKARLAARPLAAKWKHITEALEALAEVPLLDVEFAQRRRDADHRRQSIAERIQAATQREQRIQADLEGLGDVSTWLPHEEVIESLTRRLSAREQDAEALVRAREWGAALAAAMQDRRTRAGLTADDSLLQIVIPPETRRLIQDLEEDGIRCDQQLDTARQECEAKREQWADVSGGLSHAAPPKSMDRLEDVLTAMGEPKSWYEDLQEAHLAREKHTRRTARLLASLEGFTGNEKTLATLQPPGRGEVERLAEELADAERVVREAKAKTDTMRENLQQVEAELRGLQQGGGVPSEAELEQSRQHRDGLLEEVVLEQDATARSERAVTLRAAVRDADQVVDRMRNAAEQVAKRMQLEQRSVMLGEELLRVEEKQAATERALQEQLEAWDACWQQAGIVASHPDAMRGWHDQYRDVLEAREQWHESIRRVEMLTATGREWIGDLRDALGMTMGEDHEGRAATVRPSKSGAESRQVEMWPEDREPLLRNLDEPESDERESDETDAGPPEPSASNALVAVNATGSEIAGLGPEALGTYLLTLHAEAIRVRDAAEQRLADYEQQQAAMSQAKRELERAERTLSTRQAEHAAWEGRWRDAIAPLGFASQLSPREVEARLELRDELLQKQREYEETCQQVESRQTQIDEYCAEVRRLTAALEAGGADAADGGIDRAAEEVGAAGFAEARDEVNRLGRALQEARRVAESRDALLAQLEEVRQELLGLKSEQRGCEAVLRSMCEEAGCEEVSELPSFEARLEEKRGLLQRRQESEEQLVTLAESRSKSLSEFVAEVEGQHGDALQQQIDVLTAELEASESEQQALSEQIGAERTVRATMDGDDAAASSQQTLEALQAKAERLAHDYAVLTVQSIALQRAMEKYRAAHQGPVLGRAEAIFAQLTRGAYRALRAELNERDEPILMGERADDRGLVVASQMSEGTADALFLALRMASLEESLETRTPLPFIVDDVLVQFDDERCCAALELLQQLAIRTQVILFTHHRHLVELAKSTLGEDKFQLHSLSTSS